MVFPSPLSSLIYQGVNESCDKVQRKREGMGFVLRLWPYLFVLKYTHTFSLSPFAGKNIVLGALKSNNLKLIFSISLLYVE